MHTWHWDLEFWLSRLDMGLGNDSLWNLPGNSVEEATDYTVGFHLCQTAPSVPFCWVSPLTKQDGNLKDQRPVCEPCSIVPGIKLKESSHLLSDQGSKVTAPVFWRGRCHSCLRNSQTEYMQEVKSFWNYLVKLRTYLPPIISPGHDIHPTSTHAFNSN